MKNGNHYRVVIVNDDGTTTNDRRVFKTQAGVLRRLQALVQFEELQLRAGFGSAHDYKIVKA